MTKKNETRKNTRPMIKDVDRNGKEFERPDNRKTTADFIADARRVCGESYDYSPTVYLGGKQPVLIRCPKHDYTFRVAMAQNHIMRHNPTGCPICQYEKQYGKQYGPDWRDYLKLSKRNCRVGLIHPKKSKPKKSPEQIAAEQRIKEERRRQREAAEQALIDRYQAKDINEARFVEKLIARYGDIYGRELLDYQGRETKVTLVCPKHGPFLITPRTLISESKGRKPHGCWQCYGIPDPDETPPPMTAAEFFQKMRDIYGDRFDFSQSVYVNKNTSVEYICRKHGLQRNKPDLLLSGKGCDYCAGRRFWGPDFERLARQVHGDRYNYAHVGHIERTTQEVLIGCPDHGLYPQRVDLHLLGHGCPTCYGQSNKWTPEERARRFFEKAKKMFGDRFDYSDAHYVDKRTPIRIRCREHDRWFECRPNEHIHLRSNGCCPICSMPNSERTVALWLEAHGIGYDHDHPLPNLDPTLSLQEIKADFFLQREDGEWVVELNGEHHYEDIPFFYEKEGHRTFAVQQHRDRYLRQYCRDNGIRLLEIPYWEFKNLSSILQSVLIDGGDIPTFEPPTGMPYADTAKAPTDA